MEQVVARRRTHCFDKLVELLRSQSLLFPYYKLNVTHLSRSIVKSESVSIGGFSRPALSEVDESYMYNLLSLYS